MGCSGGNHRTNHACIAPTPHTSLPDAAHAAAGQRKTHPCPHPHQSNRLDSDSPFASGPCPRAASSSRHTLPPRLPPAAEGCAEGRAEAATTAATAARKTSRADRSFRCVMAGLLWLICFVSVRICACVCVRVRCQVLQEDVCRPSSSVWLCVSVSSSACDDGRRRFSPLYVRPQLPTAAARLRHSYYRPPIGRLNQAARSHTGDG